MTCDYPAPCCCCCECCENLPNIMKVTFSGVAGCPPLCPDATAFNQTHEIPFWTIYPESGACVWGANGLGVYNPDCPHQVNTFPGCNLFYVQVILTPDGDDVIVRVEATSGSAAHGVWEKRVSADELDCDSIGSVPFDYSDVPCIPNTTFIGFGGTACSLG